MGFAKLARSAAPLLAFAALGALAGCKGGTTQINGTDGVPLSQLDLSGPAPDAVVLAGPDNVIIEEGTNFDVKVAAAEGVSSHLRFTLDDGTLGIMRDESSFLGSDPATVHVTMPAPRSLTAAGSGTIRSTALTGAAEVVIGGSGTIETPSVSADGLQVTIAGSGTYIAGGAAKTLELSIGGSGRARMDGLRVDSAQVNMAGSGRAAFTSDGTVNASILGSGDVTVHGKARCTVDAVGSGTLTCDGGTKGGE